LVHAIAQTSSAINQITNKNYLMIALTGLAVLVFGDGLLAGASMGKAKVSTTIAAKLTANDLPKCGSGI
jgi:hypothetical protein